MVFVPPPPPPSPRARELGRQLQETVDAFKRDNPGLKGIEIRQAMRLAMRGSAEIGTRVAILLAVGLAILGLFAYFSMGQQMPPGGRTMILTALIVVGLLLGGLLLVLKTR